MKKNAFIIEKKIWNEFLEKYLKSINDIKIIKNITEREEKLFVDLYLKIISVYSSLDKIKLEIDSCVGKISDIPDTILQIQDLKNNYQSVPIDIRKNLELKSLKSFEKLAESNSSEIINELWELVVDMAKDMEILSWKDEKILESLKIEMILELLSSMSVFTSPIISGINKWCNFIKMEDDSLTYVNNKSSKTLDILKRNYNVKKEYIIAKTPRWVKIHKDIKLKIVPLNKIPKNVKPAKYVKSLNVLGREEQKDFLILNYIDSHVILKNSYDSNRYSNIEKLNGVQTQEKQYNSCYFLEHGSHLLGILLRASGELRLPYSSRYPGPQPIEGLMKLQDRIEIAGKELKDRNDIANWERFLMKYETERIYHLSYMAKACSRIATAEVEKENPTAGYFITQISKLLLSLDSLILNNNYIENLKAEDFNPDNFMGLEKELIITQVVTLPFIKNIFFYFLYQLSQCTVLSYLNAGKKETQLFDYYYPYSINLDTEHEGQREEYNRLFTLCRKYIDTHYQNNPMDRYVNTSFDRINVPKKAYQINLTSLLTKQVELPKSWFGGTELSSRYLIAAYNADEAAKKQIEREIEEDVISYQSVQYYYTNIMNCEFPYTSVYYNYHKDYE